MYKRQGPDGITITGHDTASASFTAPDVSETQTFTLALQVNDGEVDSAKSFVTVTVENVTSSNTAPVVATHYKGATTSGNVEWVVLYPYDAGND